MSLEEWKLLKNETIEIGKFQDFEIRYNPHKKQFVSFVKGKVITAKSEQALERQIKQILEVKFDKVIDVRNWDIGRPEILQVVKRGTRFYSVKNGKLKPIDSYHLHEYNEEIFKELTQLAEKYFKIKDRWQTLVNKLRRLS